MAATYQGDSSDNPFSSGDTGSTATASNRREHTRVSPDDQNQLAASLASGSGVRLIDLSRGGAQFECERRFLPNASVSLRLRTRDGEVPVAGRVVRSRIVRLGSGGLGYMVGVAFTNLLPMDPVDDAGASAPVDEPPAETAAATLEPAAVVAPVMQDEPAADITAEEALAFESAAGLAPAMLVVTASVDTTSEQLHDMFNGNDW